LTSIYYVVLGNDMCSLF